MSQLDKVIADARADWEKVRTYLASVNIDISLPLEGQDFSGFSFQARCCPPHNTRDAAMNSALSQARSAGQTILTNKMTEIANSDPDTIRGLFNAAVARLRDAEREGHDTILATLNRMRVDAGLSPLIPQDQAFAAVTRDAAPTSAEAPKTGRAGKPATGA